MLFFFLGFFFFLQYKYAYYTSLQGCLHISTPTDKSLISLTKQQTFLSTLPLNMCQKAKSKSERLNVWVEHTLKEKRNSNMSSQ